MGNSRLSPLLLLGLILVLLVGLTFTRFGSVVNLQAHDNVIVTSPDEEINYGRGDIIPLSINYIIAAKSWDGPYFIGRLYYFLDGGLVGSQHFNTGVGKDQVRSLVYRYDIDTTYLDSGPHLFEVHVVRVDLRDWDDFCSPNIPKAVCWWENAEQQAATQGEINSVEYYNRLKSEQWMGLREIERFRFNIEKIDCNLWCQIQIFITTLLSSIGI